MATDANPWWLALAPALPVCCGGLAVLGAGGLAAAGAFLAWKGAWLLAALTIALTVGLTMLWRRRRKTCEP